MKDTIVWFDLPVLNLERAVGFYSKVLDCKIDIITDHGMQFAMFPHDHSENGDNNQVAGCLYVAEDRKPSTDGPLIYFNVDGHLQEATAKVAINGGTVLKNAEQLGQYGYRSVIVDTEGNGVALYSKEIS